MYAPCRYSDVVTNCPPLPPRATSPAQTAPASVIPAIWSPIPPRRNGGASPGRVSRCASPPAPRTRRRRSRRGPHRARDSVPRDQAVDQARVARGDRPEVQADAKQRPGADVGQENVCITEQFGYSRLPIGCCQVEHDAAFAAVVHLERRADVLAVLRADAQHPAEHPRGVTAGRFDLDDVGSPVCERPPAAYPPPTPRVRRLSRPPTVRPCSVPSPRTLQNFAFL